MMLIFPQRRKQERQHGKTGGKRPERQRLSKRVTSSMHSSLLAATLGLLLGAATDKGVVFLAGTAATATATSAIFFSAGAAAATTNVVSVHMTHTQTRRLACRRTNNCQHACVYLYKLLARASGIDPFMAPPGS